MVKICSNCSFLEGEWGRPHCENKRTPVTFIDNPKGFGCIFFNPNENLETCESCDGTGTFFSGGEIENTNNWLMCDKCNGEGYTSTNKTEES